MSPEMIVVVAGVIISVAVIALLLHKKTPRRVKQKSYTKKWRELQKMCADSAAWPHAVLEADALVDDVLKKKQKQGKTMGERMVAAQKTFSNNDALWQAHKLASRVKQDPQAANLKESDVKNALVGFRQALRDLGAL